MDSGYLGQLIAGVFYLVVGVALLRLSGRTNENPERLLGFYFLFTGIDYTSYSVVYSLGLESLYIEADFVARVAYSIAVVHLVVFIRNVFRPGQAWANWLAALCSLSVFGGVIGSCAIGDWAGEAIDNPWYWFNFLGYTSALIWLTFEAFQAHSSAQKRLRIGLCERAVVNRYLLWGCFGLLQVVACAVIIFMEVSFAPGAPVSLASDFTLSATEVASIAALWLVFFPPAAYLAWLAGPQDDLQPAGSAAEVER